MAKEKTGKRWMVFCEPCGFKTIIHSDEKPDLVEIKTSPIPGGAPLLKKKEGDKKPVLEVKKSQSQNKKFKCPQCGRGVTAKELPKPYLDAYKDIDERKFKEHEIEEKEKRVLDGKPLKKYDPNFPEEGKNEQKKDITSRH